MVIIRRAYLAVEFTALFIFLPSLYIRLRPIFHPILAIWCLAGVCAWFLKLDGYFTRYRLWGERPAGKQILFVIGRFALIAVTLGLLTFWFEYGRFLTFPRTRPVLWLIFILLYPILSAIPQGIVYRAFIFYRYGDLFGEGWAMITASAVVFCYAHIFLLNFAAMLLTLGGGILFAHTYLKSRSLWLSSIEHALYGDFIFTIGLGYFMYSGAVR
ncbi:MAG: CPBP family intramembrane glutamic endopeptidase [Syntrophobacteraceae bacterium]